MKRSITLIILCTFFFVGNFIGCSNKDEEIYRVYMEDDHGFYDVIDSNGEKPDISEDAVYIMYSNILKSYIYVDAEKFDVYVKNNNGEDRKIASRLKYKYSIYEIGNSIYYIDASSNLYEIKDGIEEPKKIMSKVNGIDTRELNVGVFMTKEDDLYIINKENKLEKIDENIDSFFLGNNLLIYSKKGELHEVNLTNLSNSVVGNIGEKIRNGEVLDEDRYIIAAEKEYSTSVSDIDITLYYKDNDNLKKIDGNVYSYSMSPDKSKIIYLKANNGGLYYSDIENINPKKLSNDFKKNFVDNENVYIFDVSDRVLNKVSFSGEESKVDSQVVMCKILGDKLSYLKENGDLYFNGEVVLENVNFYGVYKDELVYVTKDNKFYKKKKDKEAICFGEIEKDYGKMYLEGKEDMFDNMVYSFKKVYEANKKQVN